MKKLDEVVLSIADPPLAISTTKQKPHICNPPFSNHSCWMN